MSQADNHKLELESQFVLRLPVDHATKLRDLLRSGDPLGERLKIKFDNDIRHATLTFDDSVLYARLFDLPCIIESYKTLDRRVFYKTADLSQILICKTEAPSNDSDIEPKYRHGITPPLKNVRSRRFRKTLKKKYVDFAEIEKEVKRLFKFDCEAIESRYEIVEELKDKAQPSNADNILHSGLQSAENSQNIDAAALFGEGCSTSEDSDDDDDDDDDDDKDDEIDMEQENDNDDDDIMEDEELEEVTAPEPPTVPAADIAAEVAAASDLIAQNDDTVEKRQELDRELAKIRERILSQESEMRGLDNQALRMRLQPVLDSLHEQENEIKKQLDELL